MIKILVEVSGGVVKSVRANMPSEVHIVDWDDLEDKDIPNSTKQEIDRLRQTTKESVYLKI